MAGASRRRRCRHARNDRLRARRKELGARIQRASARRGARWGGGRPAAWPSPCGAAGRQRVAEGQMRDRGEPDGLRRLGDRQGRARSARRKLALPELEVLADGQFALHGVLVAEIVGVLGEPGAAVASSRRSVPDAQASRPATRRSSVDLPTPFGPVTTSERPLDSSKETPANTQVFAPAARQDPWRSAASRFPHPCRGCQCCVRHPPENSPDLLHRLYWHAPTKLSIRPASAPAAGAILILAPNMVRPFRAGHGRTAEMAAPASSCASRKRRSPVSFG